MILMNPVSKQIHNCVNREIDSTTALLLKDFSYFTDFSNYSKGIMLPIKVIVNYIMSSQMIELSVKFHTN